MSQECRVFTVVGVLNGDYSVRIHDFILADSAPKAYEKLVAGLPARFKETSPGTTGLLGGAVFEGRIRCAHRNGTNGPWGEDRCGRVARKNSSSPVWLTVVSLDPATKALHTCAAHWLAAGNAERDAIFDFHLIASVLEGRHEPNWCHESALTPPQTTRNERITAMLRYSPHFAQFFDNSAPINMPA